MNDTSQPHLGQRAADSQAMSHNRRAKALAKKSVDRFPYFSPELGIILPLIGVQPWACLRIQHEPASARGHARVDFQRTRASKADPCSRYYTDNEFDVLCACLHAVRLQWEFAYIRPARLQPHLKCAGRLASNVVVDDRWSDSILPLLREASSERQGL